MVNKVILIGRLGRDPETRETNSGMTVAELRIATSRGRGDNEQTDWHTVVCWEDKDGNKKYKTSVVANSVQFLGSRSDAESGGGNYSRSSEKRQRSSDDEVIPF